MKIKFISKKKLLERLESLEEYVGADYVSHLGADFNYETHEPRRGRFENNPIAQLIIKSEEEK